MNKSVVKYTYVKLPWGCKEVQLEGFTPLWGVECVQSCAGVTRLIYMPISIIYQIQRPMNSQNERILNKCYIDMKGHGVICTRIRHSSKG